MSVATLSGLLICCLLVASPNTSSLLPSPQSAALEIVVEAIERVSRDEVHFWLKATNKSDRPVFTGGFDLGQGPVLELLFLEQWRPGEGWKIVVPCMDMAPPEVIVLEPGQAITLERILKLPLSAVCKVRAITLQGKFRFRFDYFDSESEAQAYIDKLPSRTEEVKVRPRLAISGAFEIPDYRLGNERPQGGSCGNDGN